jgi:hypothetical protein
LLTKSCPLAELGGFHFVFLPALALRILLVRDSESMVTDEASID